MERDPGGHFSSTFILISHNHECELRTPKSLGLQINLLTEREITKMLQLLESIGQRVGATTEDDPSLPVLEQSTRPETLVKQIEKVTGQSAAKS